MSDSDAGPGGFDDERGSEVDDYTGEIPKVEHHDLHHEPDGPQPSGFGDGDVADIDDDDTVDDAPLDLGSLVDELTAERDEYKQHAQRLQAEFENYRRRSATQAEIDMARATGRLVEALLPVFDATEAAFVEHPEEVGPLLNLMLAELRKQGLETLELEGAPFDPEVAEAVAHEPGDGGDVVVAEVLRSGYRWKGATLRAAMVRTRD